MELFTTIKFEALIAGTWTDITPDVLQNPEPKMSGMGIMGNSLMDRTGDNGTLTFSLDNSEGNSGGVVGYYTPHHASVRSGFFSMLGIEIHLYFEWDGIRRYKFHGIIDDARVIAGKYGQRRTDIHCSNWMKAAADHTLNMVGYQTNKYFDEGIQLVVGNMARRPQAYNIRAGSHLLPTLFDTTHVTTKALGEIQKLTLSEWGYTYLAGDGTSGETLTTEYQNYRSNYIDTVGSFGTPVPTKSTDITSLLLIEAGGNLLIESSGQLKINETVFANVNDTQITAMTPTLGTSMYNRAIFRTYPRTVDAAATTVLFSTDKRITLDAAEEKNDVRGTFRDPNNPDTEINGIELVTPVSGTDYTMFQNEDGTGTDLTANLEIVWDIAGSAEVRYPKLKNIGATTGYVYLQQRGKAVRIYKPNETVFDNTTGNWQRDNGVLSLDIDLPYLADLSNLTDYFGATSVWEGFLYGVAFPYPRVKSLTLNANKDSLCMAMFMTLEPGTTMRIRETVTDFAAYQTTPWFINGYEFRIRAGRYVDWSVVLVPAGAAQ